MIAAITAIKGTQLMLWSNTVDDYYDIDPKPRWGHGTAVHSELNAVIEAGRSDYEGVLNNMLLFKNILHEIPAAIVEEMPNAPFWNNVWFSVLDAASLVYFLSSRKPRQYVEIGSGFSTKFARFSINRLNLETSITSIDPAPRAEIDVLCEKVIRSRLEDCDLGIFESLNAGDILFFDGSHRVFQNSDVTVFLLEVLPRLRPGVLVHIHDIFLPFDYTPKWIARLYSEQYLLAAMLLCKGRPFRVTLPNYFICTDPKLSLQVKKLFAGVQGKPDLPFLYQNGADIPGVSFWIETVAR